MPIDLHIEFITSLNWSITMCSIQYRELHEAELGILHSQVCQRKNWNALQPWIWGIPQNSISITSLGLKSKQNDRKYKHDKNSDGKKNQAKKRTFFRCSSHLARNWKPITIKNMNGAAIELRCSTIPSASISGGFFCHHCEFNQTKRLRSVVAIRRRLFRKKLGSEFRCEHQQMGFSRRSQNPRPKTQGPAQFVEKQNAAF